MELAIWEIDFNDRSLTERASLDEILTWCHRQHNVDRMLVALRLEREEDGWRVGNPAAEQKTVSMFGDHILTSFYAAEWPGTQLIGHPGLVYVSRFDQEIKDIVLADQSSLQMWNNYEQPYLPEDICLYRQSDSHPTFLSITHEGCAFVITDKQFSLQGFRKVNYSFDELFARGPYFCTKYEG